jgi:hypothetical protein
MAAQDKARYDKQLLEFTHSHETSEEHIFDLRRPRRSFDMSECHSHSKNEFFNMDQRGSESGVKSKDSATKDTTTNINTSRNNEKLNLYQSEEKLLMPQKSPAKGD